MYALCEKVAIFLKLIFQYWLINAKNTPSGKFVIIVVSCGQIPWLSLPAVSVQIHVVYEVPFVSKLQFLKHLDFLF